jgi:uncharacterized protein (TIGR03083 family)
MMEYGAYIATIRSNIDRLGDAAEAAGLDAPVPSCPAWTVDDLTRHIGNVQRFWAGLVVSRSTDPPDFSAMAATAPGGDARFEWVRSGGQELADVLAATPEDTPMWTFASPGTVRFWARRQAHEAVIHRCDAELANGELGSIDADVAADGVNEYFELFALIPAAKAITGNGETVHFHCTDREVEWLAELTPEGAVLRPEHAKGNVAVRGPANAMVLAVWNRIGPDNPELEIFGDRDLLDRWRRLTAF